MIAEEILRRRGSITAARVLDQVASKKSLQRRHGEGQRTRLGSEMGDIIQRPKFIPHSRPMETNHTNAAAGAFRFSEVCSFLLLQSIDPKPSHCAPWGFSTAQEFGRPLENYRHGTRSPLGSPRVPKSPCKFAAKINSPLGPFYCLCLLPPCKCDRHKSYDWQIASCVWMHHATPSWHPAGICVSVRNALAC